MAAHRNRRDTAPELELGGDLTGSVARWLAHLEFTEGRSPETIEAYDRDLRSFLAYLRGHLGHAPCLADLDRLDLKAFRGFMAARRREGLTSRSLSRTMSALRTYIRWLDTTGRIGKPRHSPRRHAKTAARSPKTSHRRKSCGRGRSHRRARGNLDWSA